MAFPPLPEELVKFIFELACFHNHLKETAVLNIETTLSLLCVSRATYNLVVPLLYRSVTLDKPSRLQLFSRSLLAKPSLGLLVRNLWVGSLGDGGPLGANDPELVAPSSLVRGACRHIRLCQESVDIGRDKRETNCKETRAGVINRPSPSWTLYAAALLDPMMGDGIGMGECFVYLEKAQDYISAHVHANAHKQHQLSGGPSSILANYNGNTSPFSSSSPSCSGVDRASPGFDAVGSWIGVDEWTLRCVEMSATLEYLWEWLALAAFIQSGLGSEDTPMKVKDSEEASIRHMRSAISTISHAGFSHIDDFMTLRSMGVSPKVAARYLLHCYISSTGRGTSVNVDRHTNVHLLPGDDVSTDCFYHWALFARSGAVHLMLGSEAPTGDNAPPNSIPASAAAAATYGRERYDEDDEDDEDDNASNDENDRSEGETEGHNEYISSEERRRRQEARALDFADLYGHVSFHSRRLLSTTTPDNHGGDQTRGRRSSDESKERNEQEEAVVMVEEEEEEEEGGKEWRRVAKLRRVAKDLVKEDRLPLPTMGSLLANVRTVLAMSPRIRLLALNGFLERAVAGERSCTGLNELRHLSLGPPPPFWSLPLRLEQPTFARLKSLHISGCLLFPSEARALGGFNGSLPELREVAWTMWHSHFDEHPIDVVDSIRYILGQGPRQEPLSSSHAPRRRRKKPLKKVIATLSPVDVALFRRRAGHELNSDDRLDMREYMSKPGDHDQHLGVIRAWWEAKGG